MKKNSKAVSTQKPACPVRGSPRIEAPRTHDHDYPIHHFLGRSPPKVNWEAWETAIKRHGDQR